MQTITIAPTKRSWFSLLSWAIVLAVLVVSWQGAEMAPLTLIKDGGNMATFAADFFPPDFSQWQDYLTEMAVTLQIAVWGSALAVVLSIPFGLMSAENLVPWWVYQPVRRLMDACRAINEMVFAMLFVVAVGLGPFAGVLALFIHTTGVLSKLLSEAVEAIEPGPVEGIRATGANKLEEILYGVLPVLQATLAGLGAIDVSVTEVAKGMGMSRGQRLRKVELPLAAPVILAGVRTSVIINIGTATIASTVGASTLGTPIIIGLSGFNTAYVIQGALLVALAAIIADRLFERLVQALSQHAK